MTEALGSSRSTGPLTRQVEVDLSCTYRPISEVRPQQGGWPRPTERGHPPR